MSELVQAFMDLRKDVKDLIAALHALNNHIGELNEMVTVLKGLDNTFKRNEDKLAKLISEMEKMNKNMDLIMGVAKEVK